MIPFPSEIHAPDKVRLTLRKSQLALRYIVQLTDAFPIRTCVLFKRRIGESNE